MKKRITALLLSSLLLLSGCTKSNIVEPGNDLGPSFMVRSDIEIKWDEAEREINEQYTGEGEYEFVKSVSIEADEEGNLTVTIDVSQDADAEAAAAYAEQIIKAVNDEAAVQDFSYTPSEEDSYGGYFESHDILVKAVPEGMEDQEDSWLVNAHIKAGEFQNIKPAI